MFKRQAGHAVSAMRMAIALIPLAACEGGMDGVGAKFADAGFGFSGHRESGAGLAIMAKPTVIEQRHFDFYTNYRHMFDSESEIISEGLPNISDSLAQDAGALREDSSDAGAVASCSMRTFLMQD